MNYLTYVFVLHFEFVFYNFFFFFIKCLLSAGRCTSNIPIRNKTDRQHIELEWILYYS